MKNQHLICHLLVTIITFAVILPASAVTFTNVEKKSNYSNAIQNLEAYLESYGQTDISLPGIIDIFSELGGYEQSRQLMNYTRILAKLDLDEYDYDLDRLLGLLDKNDKFAVYLDDVLKGSAIGSVEELKAYTEGRKYEAKGQIESAIGSYERCLNFFDAEIRYTRLNKCNDKQAYDQAIVLLQNGNFAGAYFAFGRTHNYADSQESCEFIVSMLGYIPTTETDNPTPVSVQDIQVSSTQNSITLKWTEPAHATEYNISIRKKGNSDWVYDNCKTNSCSWTGLNNGTTYECAVSALAGQIVTDTAVIEVTTDRIITSNPRTPTRTPKPTNTKVPKAHLSVGDHIKFGHYEQDGKSNNGAESIEWIVLDIQENQALVISRFVLDARPFNINDASISWQGSDIRTWLNNNFIKSAFSKSERKAIMTTNISNSKNQGYYKWRSGNVNTTTDQVFLLSYAEAWKYFASNTDRYCAPTDYAILRGAETSTKYTIEGKPTCMWWLRSPGETSNSAAGIMKFGGVEPFAVHHINVGVRPALWLNLSLYTRN